MSKLLISRRAQTVFPTLVLGWSRWSRSLFWSLATSLVLATPGQAAQKIFFQYGPLVRSIQISSLETLATEGTITDDLAFYINLVGVSDQELATFREGLNRTVDIDGVLLTRFFYSDMGEEALTKMGLILRTRGGNNGKLSVRAALIKASMDPDGLSVLSVLQNLPTDMQIDVRAILDLETAVETVVQATESSVDRLALLTAESADQEPAVDYAALPDLTQPGPNAVITERWDVTDPSRDRSFYIKIVRPQTLTRTPTPVVIYSHGLSASPESRQKRAVHLASYGFLVALPQHPGSDAIYASQFKQGERKNLFDVEEFINRPLDIRFVIDELERRNQRQYGGRLNLTQIGLAGHSFGGYTALAVAGAEVHFDFLQQACGQRFSYLNVSLLLQCQALKIPLEGYHFRDDRVTAIMVTNPVNSSVFGPEGLAQIQIPVLVMAGSHDPATPAVFEQFRTFPWFTTRDRGLALIEGQAHVDLSELDAGITDLLNTIPELALASPDLIDRYSNAFGLAFAERYVANRLDYRVYLRSSYAEYLSQAEEFKLYFVGAEADQDLVIPLEQRLDRLQQLQPAGEN